MLNFRQLFNLNRNPNLRILRIYIPNSVYYFGFMLIYFTLEELVISEHPAGQHRTLVQ